MNTVRSPIPHGCVNCHRQLGIAADPPIIPHFLQDDGKTEAWCPVCFVKVRAHKETMHHGGPRFAADFHAKRLPQGMMRAIKCGNPKCGVECLAHGHTGCSQCGSKIFTVLTDAHFAAVTAGADAMAGATPGTGDRPEPRGPREPHEPGKEIADAAKS